MCQLLIINESNRHGIHEGCEIAKICIFTEPVKYYKRGTVSPQRARVSCRTKTLSLETIVYYTGKRRISGHVSSRKMRVFPWPASMYILFVIFLSHVDVVTSANSTTNTTGEWISI